MKKLAILISTVALGTLSAFAQGNIAFANTGTGQPLMISALPNGSGATPLGTNAQSVALGAGPGQVQVRLYVGTNGNAATFDPITALPTSGLVLVGTVNNLTSTASGAQGGFSGGNPFPLPAPFDGSFQVQFYYWAGNLNGVNPTHIGHSALITGYNLAVGAAPVNPTFGTAGPTTPGFTLVPIPEPSTFALCGLGAAALLLFRRRKS
jgi:hypothetical protein